MSNFGSFEAGGNQENTIATDGSTIDQSNEGDVLKSEGLSANGIALIILAVAILCTAVVGGAYKFQLGPFSAETKQNEHDETGN